MKNESTDSVLVGRDLLRRLIFSGALLAEDELEAEVCALLAQPASAPKPVDEYFGLAMLLAESAFKAGNGYDRAVPTDILRGLVDPLFTHPAPAVDLLTELFDHSQAYISAIECDHDFDGEDWANRAKALIGWKAK